MSKKTQHDTNITRRAKKLGITIGGGVLLVVGVIAIPYPGPGWLIVFAALGILAQEYPWARRALGFGRRQYDAWNKWIKKQSWFVRSLTFIATATVVVVTIWLVNGYGPVDNWLNLKQQWLHSPLLPSHG